MIDNKVIKPEGMNFFPFAYRTPKTSVSNPRRIDAKGYIGITFVAHKASGSAKAAEVISEILLPAFRKPINPPPKSRTMYIHRTITDEVGAIMAKHPSIRAHIQAQNFAGRAFHRHLHGAAADFAISGESLRGLAGVNEHFKFLTAKWALNEFRFLHKTYGVPGTEYAEDRRVVDNFVPGWLTVKSLAQSVPCYGLSDAYEI
jgi:hypothetical protein